MKKITQNQKTSKWKCAALTLLLSIVSYSQSSSPIEYPSNISPINTEVVRVNIGTYTKDLKVGYIVGDNNCFYLVPLPYVDDFTRNVLIKVGNTYKPIFNEDRTIFFPRGAEPILKVELKNAFGIPGVERSIIDALKAKVPSLANKQSKMIAFAPNQIQNTFLEFNTPLGIFRTEGVIPTASFMAREYSAFIKIGDILESFKNMLEGLTMSEVSMGFNISYTAFFAKRDFLLSSEFAEDNLLSSLSEITSTEGTAEKMLFIPMGGTGNEKKELSQRLSDYMNIQIITFKESTSSKTLSESVISDFIDKSLSSYYEQIKLANESDSTIVNFLLNNGVSLQTTVGNIKKADFSFDKEEIFKEITEKGKAKAGSTGVNISVPKYFSLGYNGSKNKSSTTKKEVFKSDIERVKKSFEGEIPVMTGISLSSIQNFSNAKTSNTYIQGKSDAEELPKIGTLYLDFDTTAPCTSADVKRMSYSVLTQSIRWAFGENIQATANANEDLRRRIDYQNQIYDRHYFSEALAQRMNNSTHERLNTIKSLYTYLGVHGQISDIQLISINDNGINKEYKYEVQFSNSLNPIPIYSAANNGQLFRDQFGQFINLLDRYGQPLRQTFGLIVTMTPDCKIETWGTVLE